MVLMTGPKLVSHYPPSAWKLTQSVYHCTFSASVRHPIPNSSPNISPTIQPSPVSNAAIYAASNILPNLLTSIHQMQQLLIQIKANQSEGGIKPATATPLSSHLPGSNQTQRGATTQSLTVIFKNIFLNTLEVCTQRRSLQQQIAYAPGYHNLLQQQQKVHIGAPYKCWAVCAFKLVISASMSWIVWLQERTESVISGIKIFRGNRSIPWNGRVKHQ